MKIYKSINKTYVENGICLLFLLISCATLNPNFMKLMPLENRLNKHSRTIKITQNGDPMWKLWPK